MRHASSAIVMALAIYLPAFLTAQEPAPAQAVKIVTPLKLKNFPKLIYPGSVDREALVYLRFNVGLDGKAYGIEVENDGFHEKRFVDMATRTLRNASFEPATEDGVPVPSLGARMPFRFSISAKGATPEFIRENREVVKLIEASDFAGAHFHAQWMMSEKVKLIYEYAILHATLATTYAQQGDKLRALAAVRRATAHASMSLQDYRPGDPLPKVSANDFLLDRKNAIQLLKLRFMLSSANGFHLDAAKTHAYAQALGGIPENDPTMDPFRRTLEHIRDSPTLVGQARIDDSGYWQHEPYHRTFSVAGVKGELQAIHLSCTGNARQIEFAPDVEWTIPAGWAGCTLNFHGKPDTEFRIVEFRTGSEAGA